jgi:UDP-N-acetylmuramate dehydrogenase
MERADRPDKDPGMSLFAGFEHIVRAQEPLAPYTWLRIGGKAEYFAEPTSLAELQRLVQHCHTHNVPVRVIGGGSRVLVRDSGVPGLVLQLSAPAFSKIEVSAPTITAGGGAKLGHLVSTSVREGLAGLESLVGIPGTVAGALRGNAESGGAAIGQWTSAATVLTHKGEMVQRQRAELRFSYGGSSLDELVILGAEFQLEPADVTELTRRMQKAWIVRRTAQPSSNLGMGRIFKDPQGLAAAELIEQVGLRGHKIGAAQISDVSANFIEVEPGVTSDQVEQLIELMRSKVLAALGVELECELEVW